MGVSLRTIITDVLKMFLSFHFFYILDSILSLGLPDVDQNCKGPFNILPIYTVLLIVKSLNYLVVTYSLKTIYIPLRTVSISSKADGFYLFLFQVMLDFCQLLLCGVWALMLWTPRHCSHNLPCLAHPAGEGEEQMKNGKFMFPLIAKKKLNHYSIYDYQYMYV